MLMARDCNGMNSGSWLLRNTPWAHTHMTHAHFLNDSAAVSAPQVAPNTLPQTALTCMLRVACPCTAPLPQTSARHTVCVCCHAVG
jgi:hypothetical protein